MQQQQQVHPRVPRSLRPTQDELERWLRTVLLLRDDDEHGDDAATTTTTTIEPIEFERDSPAVWDTLRALYHDYHLGQPRTASHAIGDHDNGNGNGNGSGSDRSARISLTATAAIREDRAVRTAQSERETARMHALLVAMHAAPSTSVDEQQLIDPHDDRMSRTLPRDVLERAHDLASLVHALDVRAPSQALLASAVVEHQLLLADDAERAERARVRHAAILDQTRVVSEQLQRVQSAIAECEVETSLVASDLARKQQSLEYARLKAAEYADRTRAAEDELVRTGYADDLSTSSVLRVATSLHELTMQLQRASSEWEVKAVLPPDRVDAERELADAHAELEQLERTMNMRIQRMHASDGDEV